METIRVPGLALLVQHTALPQLLIVNIEQCTLTTLLYYAMQADKQRSTV